MSIIYEALKKTDAQNQKLPEQKPAKKYLTFVMVILGIAGAVGIVRYLDNYAFIKSNKPAAKHLVAEAQPSSMALAPEIAANKLPAAKITETKSAFPDNLVLTGILVSEDGNLALIDDRILKVGDTIDGAAILNIQPDRVELSYQNQKITLKNR